MLSHFQLIVLPLLLCSGAAAAAKEGSYLRAAAAEISDASTETDLIGHVNQGQRQLQTWTMPTWWKSYHRKFKKQRLKKCNLLKGEVPVSGTSCPANSIKGAGWYLCMFGKDQNCDATTGPIPGFPGITGSDLGDIHPTTACTCKDLIWSCDDWKPCASNVYQDQYGVLDVTLPLITNEGILDGYDSPDEINADIEEAAKFFVIQVMKQQKGQKNNQVRLPQLSGGVQFDTVSSVASQSSPSAAGQTDFETNNQEQGVDEADVVKSDGAYVYAAYGDVLVVWNALTGAYITNVTMPEIETNQNLPYDGELIDVPIRPLIRPPFFYQPTPTIRSLLLESNRLVVIVEGYGYYKRLDLNLTTTVLYELLSTNVRVYDTSTLSSSGVLTFVKEVDINGAFQDGRAIGENIHIVTSSGLNTWEWLSAPLQKWSGNFPDGQSEEDYIIQAGNLAKDKLIPAFVEQLMKEISIAGTPELVGIALWESALSGIESFTFDGGAIQAYTQVTSFSAVDPTLTLSLAGSFMPTSWGYTYSTQDKLLISAEGWDYMPAIDASGPTTYFLGMQLVGPTAIPIAIGSLPGRLLNQYSLDIFDGHLRAATNIPNLWKWPIYNGVYVEPELVSANVNQVVILEIPVSGAGGTAGVFTEVGRIANLGKEGETFTAVRFFDNIAYAVTFLRKDPFYVLDLDIDNPRILGELEITGFSSYLHSINDDNSLILAIGEEADNDGIVLGLKIALFDSTDPSNPTLLQNYTVEQDRDMWSSSTASWDFKAFRYLPLQTPEVGILILPVTVYAAYPSTEGNFDGFITYDVSRQGISERGLIPHVQSDQFYGCYGSASLPQRSLVFNGNVTTIKGHSIISTDLDTFNKTWELDLDDGIGGDKGGQCYFWFF